MNVINQLTSPYLLSFEVAQLNLALYCRDNKSLCTLRKRMVKKEQATNALHS